MAVRSASIPLLVLQVLIFSEVFVLAHAATRVGFYSSSCARVETIIKQKMQAHFSSDPTIAPALLRMFFHDCFVTGCDASLLLDSSHGEQTEKDNGANLSVRGYEVIDDIKQAVEAACPGIVSCADILAFATRDSVVLAGGPEYSVGGGRFDSLTSSSSDADGLPSDRASVTTIQRQFASHGFSVKDMVALLGAHTLGVTHCGTFSDRLFNFRNTGEPDPSMSADLVSELSMTCPNRGGVSNSEVALDQGTRDVFDSSFYTQLTQGHGILLIDQALNESPLTAELVSMFTNQGAFFSSFVQSMIKLGDLNIKGPNEGQVRLQCSKVNSQTMPPPAVPSSPPERPTTVPIAPPRRNPEFRHHVVSRRRFHFSSFDGPFIVEEIPSPARRFHRRSHIRTRRPVPVFLRPQLEKSTNLRKRRVITRKRISSSRHSRHRRF
ncbi:hypothetical protein KP509_20G084700 [Ceratopteris richardii]|uniref:peroxidase n=1 Tax=Ceratopteris richardii TaxID=49495 RepID=A0A8T2SJ32_CERRI|nr:hypothetical protein KP509_20G084700 [Ceratopteris richardii]